MVNVNYCLFATARLLSDYDINILSKRMQKVYKALNRKAIKLTANQSRHLWLVNAHHLGCLYLSQFFPLYDQSLSRETATDSLFENI